MDSKNTIGTLGEKSVHAELKLRYCPDVQYHEIKNGRYVADILCGKDIFEIQTRQLFRLRSKLGAFLPEYRVTVVYPIESKKTILWTDPNTGELTERRVSPKKMTLLDGLGELYGIREFLLNENLRIIFPIIETEEIRLLNGISPDRKKRAEKRNRYISQFISEDIFCCPEDYRKLLPESLPEEFTSKDFSAAAKIKTDQARKCINVMSFLGIVEKINEKGRLKVYSVINNAKNF